MATTSPEGSEFRYEDIPPLVSKFEAFIKNQNTFHEALGSLADTCDVKQLPQASESGTVTLRSFNECVREIVETDDSSAEEKLNIIAALITGHDSDFVDFAKAKFSCNEFKKFEDGRVKSLLNPLFDTIDEETDGDLLEAISGFYGSYLTQEIDHFISHIDIKDHEEIAKNRRNNIVRSIFDVVKVAVGVTIALEFNRRRK